MQRSALNKALRLLWLWVRAQSGQVRVIDYAKEFKLDTGNASREIRYDLPAFDRALRGSLPALYNMLQETIKLGVDFDLAWMTALPTLPTGGHSEMELKLVVDHVNKVIRWEAFDQVIKVDDQEVARVQIPAGCEKIETAGIFPVR